MKELTINPEFHELIPPISSEEYALLEESLLEEGCREALVTWNDMIIDGHNRYELCRKHGIGFTCLEKEFENEDEAKVWIICNQLGRRNLTREQMSYLRGIRYNLEKKKEGGRSDRDLSGDQNEHPKTAEKIAEETGVSAPTVRRDAEFAEAVDDMPPEEKKAVLSGKSKKTKKQIMNERRLGKDKGRQKKKIKLGPPSNGMQFARIAIMNLEKITNDDLERKQAFASIKQWIKNHERRE